MMANTYPTNLGNDGFRVTFHFESGAFKWKEEFFWSQAVMTSGFAAVAADAQVLLNARLVMLSPGSKYLYTSIAAVNVPGLGWEELTSPGLAPPGPVVVAAGTVYPPWMSLPIALADASGYYHRQVWLRGWEKSDFVLGSPGTPTPLTSRELAAFISVLLSTNNPPNGPTTNKGDWCILGASRDPAVSQQIGISLVNPVAGGCQTQFILANNALFPVGGIVRIHNLDRCKPSGLNGRHKIAFSAAGSFNINRVPCHCCAVMLNPKATAALVNNFFYPLANASIGRFSLRKTGGKPPTRRGRKKARCS
jgi:hypothetical protein